MTREIEIVFTDAVYRFRQDTEGFSFTEREKGFWSSLPDSGLRLQIGGVSWVVLRNEAAGDYRIGEYLVIDQGVRLHDYEHSRLSKVIDYIINDSTDVPLEGGADPTSSEDDFWFRAYPSFNELMVCLAFPDRAYLQYVRGRHIFASCDPTFGGPSVKIWDPGMTTLDVPRTNFVTKEFAIRKIREFFDCGFIAIDERWEQLL